MWGTIDFQTNVSLGIMAVVIIVSLYLIFFGDRKGAENGILFKNAEWLENLHKVDTIMFDKTGTITKGEAVVTDIVPIRITERELLMMAASAEKNSEHHLAQAIVNKAKEEGVKILKPSKFNAIEGHGVAATISSKEVLVGNLALI